MKKISVLSWNIQGEINITGHTLFKNIQPELIRSNADIIALQEVVDAKKLFIYKKFLREYHILVPKRNTRNQNKSEGFNYNVILSKYPFVQVTEIVFPNFGQTRTLENITRADIRVGPKTVRIYNCHFPIFRTTPELRLQMLRHLAQDSKNFIGPIIICGDMNTTVPKPGLNKLIIGAWHQIPNNSTTKQTTVDERKTFNTLANKFGFSEALALDNTTWSPFKTNALQLFHLKLDWFITKGLIIDTVTLGEYISDHRSILTLCEFN